MFTSIKLAPPPQILHNLCFSFLLGITADPREIENSAHAKFWGVNKVHYGRCASGALGNLTAWSCSDGKKMNQKVCWTCRLVVYLIKPFLDVFRRSRGHCRRGCVSKLPELRGCGGNSVLFLQNSPTVQFDATPSQSPRHYKVTNHQRRFSPTTALYLIYNISIYDHSRSVTFRFRFALH